MTESSGNAPVIIAGDRLQGRPTAQRLAHAGKEAS